MERPKPKNAFHYLQAQELRKEKKNNNKKATLLDYKENTHPGKDAKKKKKNSNFFTSAPVVIMTCFVYCTSVVYQLYYAVFRLRNKHFCKVFNPYASIAGFAGIGREQKKDARGEGRK